MNTDIIIALYVMGGLFATGICVSHIFQTVASDWSNTDLNEKVKTIFMAILMFLFVLALNICFSWVAAGFWLHQTLLGYNK